MSRIHSRLGGVGALLILGFASLASAQSADHLQCYRVRDPLRLTGPLPSWLDLEGQFGVDKCRVLRGSIFCSPVSKTVTAPIQRKLVRGGAFEDFVVDAIPGAVEQDKICYRIRCEEDLQAPPNPSLEVNDQFASRTITRRRPFLLCGPAVQGGCGALVTSFTGFGFVAVDGSGDVYTSFPPGVRKYDATGNLLLTFGSSGTGDGQFGSINGIAVDAAGNIYVADRNLERIQKFDSNGTFLTKWGTPGSADGQFFILKRIAVDGSGNVYATDSHNNRVQKFDSNGTFLTKWGTPGTANGQFHTSLSGIATDGSGSVYTTETNLNRVQKFNSTGTFLLSWGGLGSGDGKFDRPTGIAVDGDGDVYVADAGNQRIQKFDSNGTFISKWTTGGPFDVAADDIGNVYVDDPNTIARFLCR